MTTRQAGQPPTQVGQVPPFDTTVMSQDIQDRPNPHQGLVCCVFGLAEGGRSWSARRRRRCGDSPSGPGVCGQMRGDKYYNVEHVAGRYP